MPKSISIFIISLLLGACSFDGIAMQNSLQEYSYPSIDSNTIQSYKTQKEFIYHNLKDSEPSITERFFDFLSNIIESIFGKGTGDFMSNIFPYLLIIIAVVLILMKVSNISFSSLTRRNKKMVDFESLNPNETNINEINFQKSIKEAVQQKEYRLAIRFMFLNVLKDLSEKEIILFKPDKTNSDYVLEINKDVRNEFKMISDIYDHIWYGESIIDETYFNEIDIVFKVCSKKLILS